FTFHVHRDVRRGKPVDAHDRRTADRPENVVVDHESTRTWNLEGTGLKRGRTRNWNVAAADRTGRSTAAEIARRAPISSTHRGVISSCTKRICGRPQPSRSRSHEAIRGGISRCAAPLT